MGRAPTRFTMYEAYEAIPDDISGKSVQKMSVQGCTMSERASAWLSEH